MDFLDRRWLQVGEGFPRLQVATSRTWIPWIVSGYEWVMILWIVSGLLCGIVGLPINAFSKTQKQKKPLMACCS